MAVIGGLAVGYFFAAMLANKPLLSNAYAFGMSLK